MRNTLKTTALMLAMAAMPVAVQAQSEIYPEHFDLEEVTLLDSPFKTALYTNNKLLLQYDADRLMAPFIRQAGLANKAGSKYNGWLAKHPSFTNWGLPDWSLEGHVGGHYLTALALAYAATNDDDAMRKSLKERLDYCLEILRDCQEAFDEDVKGMYGFLGGQPINQIWTGLYAKNLDPFKQYGGWVPFYCEHKTLAGLRDAWIYTDSKLAKTLFRKMCDWSVNVVSNLTEAQMQDILGWEHGGMNEPLADAYRLFGDEKYLTAAKKYSHKHMINGMQTLDRNFLTGKHANTQVPKYIGFERVYQEYLRDGKAGVTNYRTAAHNFWDDVAEHRTVCIGGNSMYEHFLSPNDGTAYINSLDGPESCNTNNMLKLSENLFDETHDACYADFYENATWNHILSTQDPKTGGYVYFTTLRPQGYRIYSQVNQGMWCCVGTGLENHSKYGHFIYTHSEDNKTLYVNMFTASKLDSDDFALTQETEYPYEQATKITIQKSGDYTLAIRHPEWTTADYSISVNGQKEQLDVTEGKASYAKITRSWKKGDVVTVAIPMTLRMEQCPGYYDFVAFKYGPILLAAQTTATSQEEAAQTGLTYEKLQNVYAGEGRMDHAPGVVGKGLPVSSSPLLIGERADVLSRIRPFDAEKDIDKAPASNGRTLRFTIDASHEGSTSAWNTLTLVPFYSIHHARYQCYWYQQTKENYLNSDMGRAEKEAAMLADRTIDFVATGEQQSEAGHLGKYSSNSTKGSYNDEFYRDAQSGGWFEFVLETKGMVDSVSLMVRYTTADKGRVGRILIDGEKLIDVTVPETHSNSDSKGFYNDETPIPASMLEGKSSIVVRFEASGNTALPGLYYLRLLSAYGCNAYKFVASDWTTGDGGRVSASNVVANSAENYLTVKAGTGNNNVCLMLKTEGKSYTLTSAQHFLVVKGTNLSVASGKNYLWWLNGKNEASSVPPTYTGKAADGQTVIAWDINKSGINDNCVGWTWDICRGQTIFGLTSTTGTSRITHIGFYESVEDYLATVGIEEVTAPQSSRLSSHYKGVYNLQGQQLSTSSSIANLPKGVYIVDGQLQYHR